MQTQPNSKARSQHPAYPTRFYVPDDKVSWENEWHDYSPVTFTANSVLINDRTKLVGGWCDPEQVSAEELLSRTSYCSKIVLDERGHPRNPVGRTGMNGRGCLGKWGPNHVADPVVTRINPSTKVLEMIVIQRQDTKEWSIPGGMVDVGERVSATLKRDIEQETDDQQDLSESQKKAIMDQVDELFASQGMEVYKGYVDDSRNTDNAWIETISVHFHCSDNLAKLLPLHVGEGIQWLPLENNEEEIAKFYSYHSVFVNKIIRTFRVRVQEEKDQKQKEQQQQTQQQQTQQNPKNSQVVPAATRAQPAFWNQGGGMRIGIALGLVTVLSTVFIRSFKTGV